MNSILTALSADVSEYFPNITISNDGVHLILTDPEHPAAVIYYLYMHPGPQANLVVARHKRADMKAVYYASFSVDDPGMLDDLRQHISWTFRPMVPTTKRPKRVSCKTRL